MSSGAATRETPRIEAPWGSTEPPQRTRATAPESADVVVVGAGILGLTTALFLRRSGARVVLLEARHVAAAASGNNTAKVSALQGTAYSQISKKVSAEAAERYATANERGIELMAELVDELGIECSWRRVTNYTFAEDDGRLADVEEEAEAAREAGLAVDVVSDTPLPFEVAGAVRLAEQAEFDPVDYLRGLAAELDRSEASVFEGARVVSVTGNEVVTELGASVTCERVLLATHLPTVDHVGLFARAVPHGSYSVAARQESQPLEGMYINARGDRSIRSAEAGGEQLLVVGGEGARLGSGDTERRVATLEDYARDRFGVAEITHRWDAHDFVTEDRLPFVGAVGPRSERILTGTGFNKWGLALSTAVAEMLTAALNGEHDPWPKEWDSRRLPRPRSLGPLAEHGVVTGAHLVGDRFKRASEDDLSPGEGAVVGDGLKQRAVYRDETGELRRLSARCTHLGCIVAWNQATRTWDCPCHGSRFATDGSVLEGPATDPLAAQPEEDER